MTRKFKTANYEETLNLSVTLREVLPSNHLARFVVDVIAQLDLSAIYARYAPRGGEAFTPEILLGLLFYGYATGVFSSRKIEKATYESLPFRFIAGNLHPDHDTIAHFRKTFLSEIPGAVCPNPAAGADSGGLEAGEPQPGRHHDPRRCLQEPGGQLQAVG
jgi:transposase